MTGEELFNRWRLHLIAAVTEDEARVAQGRVKVLDWSRLDKFAQDAWDSFAEECSNSNSNSSSNGTVTSSVSGG